MYLLDTNILSELVRRLPDPRVESRFESEPERLFTSVICLEEIRFGTRIGPPGNKLWERMEADVLPHLFVLAFDAAAAILAGDLRAEWKTLGTPAGYGDGLIAATAKAHRLVLVTRNVRHFDHVSGLTVENWFH
ncbi:MAG: PIN domain-containing protein [Verrucomicrobiota bacterium]